LLMVGGEGIEPPASSV